MIDYKATAAALLKAAEEFKNCKRSAKTGKVNENSRHAVKVRLVRALQAAGEERSDAWDMAHDLARKLTY